MKTMISRFLSPLALLAGALASLSTSEAQTTISGLPAITTVQSATLVPVVDVSGTPTTKKATVAQLIAGLPNASGGAAGLLTAANYTLLSGATNSATASTLVLRDSNGRANFSYITLGNAPAASSDAATKAYVDAAVSSLNIHTPANAATTGSNITLAGGAPSTLDGLSLIVNQRILVKDQSDPTQNGIYTIQTLGSGSNGTWVRAADANSGANLITGSYVFIIGGTVNASAAYVMTTAGPITIGTSNIVWTLFSQVIYIQAANVIGQLVASQVADSAITVAKFATGIQPVSIVSSLPSPSGYTGPSVVYNTSDGQLYRYSSGAWTLSYSATNMTDQITTTQIANNSISTPLLQAGSITTTQIAAGAVTAGQIAANAVTAGTIAAGAISSSQISAGAINTAQIAAGAVTATQIAANTITAGQIAAGTITGSLIAANTITASLISSGTITATQIAAGTITAAQIASGTITATQIASGTITADRLNVSTLSAISADLGTVTAGTITSSSTISIGSGLNQTVINPSGTSFGSGAVTVGAAGGGAGMTITYGGITMQWYSSSGVGYLTLNSQIELYSSGAAYFSGNVEVDGTFTHSNIQLAISSGVQCVLYADLTSGADHAFGNWAKVDLNGSPAWIPYVTSAP